MRWTTSWTAVALGLAALQGACSGPEMETRTFVLEHLDPYEAAALVEPYVYTDRDGASGQISSTESGLTVREYPENLDRIAETLHRLDAPPREVRLEFMIIEANGFQDSDPALAPIEAELMGLLAYDGYRLLGQSVYLGREGHEFRQAVLTDPTPFQLRGRVGSANETDGIAAVDLEIELGVAGEGLTLISTAIQARDGQTVVLGTSPYQTGAFILAMKPRIGPAPTR